MRKKTFKQLQESVKWMVVHIKKSKLQKSLERSIQDAKEDKVTSVGEGKQFTTVRAMMEDMKKKHKARPWWEKLWDMICSPFWALHRFYDARWLDIRDIFYRAKRGYGVSDWWGMGNYLIKTSLAMLKDLKKNGHCILFCRYPETLDENTNWDDQEKIHQERLDKMIWAFEYLAKITSYEYDKTEYFYTPYEDWSDEEHKRTLKIARKFSKDKDLKLYKYKVVSKKDSKKIQEGLQLFIKYLWVMSD